MHFDIVKGKVKDVLAGNKPHSFTEAKENLPWVGGSERVAYSLLAIGLGTLHSVQSGLPAPVKRMLFSKVRDIDPASIPPELLTRYEPSGPVRSGSDFELYVFRAKRSALPHLAIAVQKDLSNTSLTVESVQHGHNLHKELLPEFVSWQSVQERDLGGERKHLVRVAEYVTILSDITVRQTKKAVIALKELLSQSPAGTQERFIKFVYELVELERRGIYLDIGGKNNVVVCKINGDGPPVVRVLDTGMIGISDATSSQDTELIQQSGIKVARVTEDGAEGSWSAKKYRAYVAQLQEIAGNLR